MGFVFRKVDMSETSSKDRNVRTVSTLLHLTQMSSEMFMKCISDVSGLSVSPHFPSFSAIKIRTLFVIWRIV